MKFFDTAPVVPVRALVRLYQRNIDTVERAVRDCGITFSRTPSNQRYLTPRQAERVGAQLNKRRG